MVNANELCKNQKERESKIYLTYDKIYERIEKKICTASLNNYYYTWYVLPDFLIGVPMYSLEKCSNYIVSKLEKNQFEIISYQNNLLLIKWNSIE